MNGCIELAQGRQAVSASMIKEAEADYSKKRLRSLADEWFSDYPNLIAYAQILVAKPSSFKISELTDEVVEKFIIDSCSDDADDPIYKAGQAFIDKERSLNSFMIMLLKILYHVGIIGIKPDSFTEPQWSFKEKASISDGQIKKSATVYVHKMFWRALGINPVSTR